MPICLHFHYDCYKENFATQIVQNFSLKCFDSVGWTTEGASGL